MILDVERNVQKYMYIYVGNLANSCDTGISILRIVSLNIIEELKILPKKSFQKLKLP